VYIIHQKVSVSLILPFGYSSENNPIPTTKMGIPYSKQINIAFDQVAPLVAAGFIVLQTTRNITYLLAAIQVLTAVFLFLILITLLALIITVSPDLEFERKELVTPAVREIIEYGRWYARWVKVGLWIVVFGAAVGSAGGWYVTTEVEVVDEVEGKADGGGDADPDSK
jgi:hypothetical protein